VICGDLPSDYAPAETIRHPREAVRRIAEEWREQVRLMTTGERPAAVRVGRPEEWAALAPLLETRALMLLEWVRDDSVWADIESS
jgi:hypothetical protein